MTEVFQSKFLNRVSRLDRCEEEGMCLQRWEANTMNAYGAADNSRQQLYPVFPIPRNYH